MLRKLRGPSLAVCAAALFAWQPELLVAVAIWCLPLGLFWFSGGQAAQSRVFAAVFFLFAATISPLRHAIETDDGWQIMQRLIFDPAVLATAWGAIALCWIVAEILTVAQLMVCSYYRMRDYRRLGNRVRAICSEWGLAIPADLRPDDHNTAKRGRMPFSILRKMSGANADM